MKYRILIADDDEGLVEVMAERLNREGYSAITATEGVRAVELAHRERPDLIILDWKMPCGAGDAVLDALSKKDSTRNIPVIILTGFGSKDIRDEAMAKGASAYIRKPYEHDELLQVIRTVLAGSHKSEKDKS